MLNTNWRPGGNSFTNDDWAKTVEFFQKARAEFEEEEERNVSVQILEMKSRGK